MDANTTCPYCGDPLTGRQRKKCGKPECKRAFQNERCRVWQAEYKAKHGVKHGKRTEEDRQKRQQEKARWNAANPESVKASWARDAVKATARRQAGARKRQALRKLRQAAKGQEGTVTWTAGECHECGDPYVAQGPGPRFCSEAHKRRASSARRRARLNGCVISLVRRHRVYTRDNWTCQLCGDPVNRHAHPLADDAPSIDHILPVVRNGAHSESNLQCAHRYCNSVKGGRDWADVA